MTRIGMASIALSAIACVAAGIWWFGPGNAMLQPAATSQAFVSQRAPACAACHGRGGVPHTPTFPTIAGQPTSYLVHVMTAYRDGGRENAIMAAQMRGLTDAQIRALAVFYHDKASPLTRQP